MSKAGSEHMCEPASSCPLRPDPSAVCVVSDWWLLGNPCEGHSFKQVGNRCAGDSPQDFDSKHDEGKKVFALPMRMISFCWKPPLMTCHIFTCKNIFRNVTSRVLENSVCVPNSFRWCWTLLQAYVSLSLVKLILSMSELPVKLGAECPQGRIHLFLTFQACKQGHCGDGGILQALYVATHHVAGPEHTSKFWLPQPASYTFSSHAASHPLAQQLYLSCTPNPSCVVSMLCLVLYLTLSYWLDVWAWLWTRLLSGHLSLDGWPTLVTPTKPSLLFFIRCCGTVHLAHEVAALPSVTTSLQLAFSFTAVLFCWTLTRLRERTRTWA